MDVTSIFTRTYMRNVLYFSMAHSQYKKEFKSTQTQNCSTRIQSITCGNVCFFGFLLSSKNKSLMGVVEQTLIFPVCVSLRGRLKEKCLLNMHHSIVSPHQKDRFIKNIVNSCTTFRKVKLWKRIINDWLLPVVYLIPSK